MQNLAAAPSPSPKAQTPDTPILRIEAGMHMGSIRATSADAAGRIELTVSDDKTARLWELPSGRPLRVLRPPIGEGDEGKLVAGALSPDGSVAAVGGVTSLPGEARSAVYLFDTASGRLLRTLATRGGGSRRLQFSPDGRWLAGVLSESGLRIWESGSGREVARDEAYGDSSQALSWHGNDRLVTACADGKVRLYETGALDIGTHDAKPVALVPGAVVTPVEGKWPSSAAFSPDGTLIAVGYAEAVALAVLEGRTLEPRATPYLSGVITALAMSGGT